MTERAGLEARAIEILRQEVPEELEWVPWREIPKMHWAEDDSAVDERIPKGWLVLAARRGEPEPDEQVSRDAALFAGASAEALGAWLLRTWIEHDTTENELTEERKSELRAMAERAASLAQRLGRGGTDPEERYRQMLAQETNRPAPSSLPHKGLLAIAAACAGGEVARDVESYLAARHRERPEQCRALLEMLSWIDGKDAAEVLAGAEHLAGLGEVAAELLAARARRS